MKSYGMVYREKTTIVVGGYFHPNGSRLPYHFKPMQSAVFIDAYDFPQGIARQSVEASSTWAQGETKVLPRRGWDSGAFKGIILKWLIFNGETGKPMIYCNMGFISPKWRV